MSCRLLILLPERLNERLSVRVEEFLTPLLPRRSKFRCRNIPVRPAILQPGPHVPAEVLHRGTTEKLVAVVDLINNKAGLKHNHVRNHGVVNRIGVLAMSRSFYTVRPRIGKKRPVGTYSAAIFIRLGNVIGADRNQSAIGNFELTMQLNQQFGLRRSLGQEPPGLRTSPMGCCPCNSESFRRLAL